MVPIIGLDPGWETEDGALLCQAGEGPRIWRAAAWSPSPATHSATLTPVVREDSGLWEVNPGALWGFCCSLKGLPGIPGHVPVAPAPGLRTWGSILPRIPLLAPPGSAPICVLALWWPHRGRELGVWPWGQCCGCWSFSQPVCLRCCWHEKEIVGPTF